MTGRSRRFARAGAALLMAAGALSPLVARAQSTTTTSSQSTRTCVDLGAREELRFEFCGPADQRSTQADYPLTVIVTNTGRNVFGDFSVTSVQLTLASTLDDQRLPEPATKTWTGPAARQASVDWIPSFTTNGTYDLEIVAEGNRPGGQQASGTMPIKLAVAPRAPTEVKAQPAPEGTVAVTWNNTAREPDTLYYEVSRAAVGADTYEQLDVVHSARDEFVDTPAPGSWRYRVTALRRGATAAEGLTSAPATSTAVDVAPPPDADAAADGGGAAGSTPTTAAGSSAAGSRSTTTTARPSISNSTRTTVNLSGFASTLNSRLTPTTVRRVEPDPGFSETLPFDIDPAATEPEPEAPPLELAEAPEALGEELISDDGERRRSLGFVAFGLLLFVLGMTGLFLKAEVRRADELEAIDDGEAGDADPAPTSVPEPVHLAPAEPEPELEPVAVTPPVPVPVAVASPVSEPEFETVPVAEPVTAPAPAVVVPPLPARRRSRSDARAAARAERAAELAALFGDEPPSTADDDDRHLAELAASLEADAPAVRPDRRVRRTVAPIDAPDLDVPDPVVTPPTPRTSTHARRAPTRLPSRPADDRREGGAAVRPRRRGTGQGHRRVPLG